VFALALEKHQVSEAPHSSNKPESGGRSCGTNGSIAFDISFLRRHISFDSG
jgi:hypothetical protein